MRKSTEVVRGTTSRTRGGTTYVATYILDAVLLADKLKDLSKMASAVEEILGLPNQLFES